MRFSLAPLSVAGASASCFAPVRHSLHNAYELSGISRMCISKSNGDILMALFIRERRGGYFGGGGIACVNHTNDMAMHGFAA